MKRFYILLILTVICIVQTHAQSGENDIKIFPNPATNVINVLGLNNSPNASIIITDIYGTKVISHQWVIRHNALNIPVFNLEKGVYLISIQTEHQNIQRKFFKE